MASIKRFRFWQRENAALSLADALARAAAAGEPVKRLVELTARSLLESGNAARAGVWLRSDEGAGALQGVVVDRGSIRAPESWGRFEAMIPELEEALRHRQPMVLNLREVAWAAVLGPLAGMKAAAILPLHCGEEMLGLALVGYTTEPVPELLDRLEAIVDQLAVTASERQLRTRSEHLSRQLDTFSDLQRALAAGESPEKLLKRLAAAAKQGTGASFVAVARRAGVGVGLSFAAFEGPPGIVPLLGAEGLAPVWRTAVQHGRAAVENIRAVPSGCDWGEALREHGAAIVLALPLEANGEPLGALAAGYGADVSPAAAKDRLAPYAALAAAVLRDDLQRAHAATSDAALSGLLEGSGEMVLLLDAGGRVRHASRAAREKLGLAPGRGENPRLEEIFPAAVREQVAGWRAASQQGERPAALEVSPGNGRSLRLRVQATRHPDGGWQVGVEDLSALRSAERRGREVDAELAAVLDSMESGTLLFDSRARLRQANARFAHLVGLEPRLLAKIPDFEALLEAVRDRFRDPRAVEERWRAIFQRGDEAAWDELEVAHPSRRVVERFARPVLSPDGERLGWLELYRDITGQRLIQSKLLQAEKMAALGQLVSGIAHELNNPLTGIMGYAQLLLSRPLDPQRSAEARRIFEEAERAGRIVKNLLLFAREAKPERKPVNLNEIVERTIALRSYELKVQNIAIEKDLQPDLPPVLADAHQLQQVVLNLIVNAEQAIQQGRGSGRIAIRTRRVSPLRLVLQVADDGPGIAPENVSRIFDPFFTTKPVGVGTGLGLSILYGIVQEHGGEVSVESRPGQGTTFLVELPLALEPIKISEQEMPRIAPPRVLAPPCRVLVVEDEPTVAQLVVDVLREEGHQAEALLDSVEALHRLNQQHYDLVICDLKMPKLDGQSLYQALVRGGNPVQNRMIFITGDTLTPRTLDFLERNTLTYLAKPFLVEELKRAVRRMLENGGMRLAPPRPGGKSGGKREASRK